MSDQLCRDVVTVSLPGTSLQHWLERPRTWRFVGGATGVCDGLPAAAVYVVRGDETEFHMFPSMPRIRPRFPKRWYVAYLTVSVWVAWRDGGDVRVGCRVPYDQAYAVLREATRIAKRHDHVRGAVSCMAARGIMRFLAASEKAAASD